jgi:Bacterial Ig-like domain (group 3)/FG-GAP-like repeat/FG-GAP repeat
MTRKVTGEARTLRSVFLFITTLSVLVTVAAIAQMTGTRQAHRKTHVELQNAIAPPQTRGRSIQPGQSGHLPVSRAKGSVLGPRVTDPENPLFLPAVTYSSGGGGAHSLATRDLNADGKLDVVVANDYSNSVGVLLGNGDGTFQPAVTYDAGGISPRSVAVADVNGDGKPDLIVANCGNRCAGGGAVAVVAVLLGNGDGTFQSAVAYGSGGDATGSVAVADVNGDGKPDLLAANQCADTGDCGGDGTVSVLLGNGDGTFRTAVAYDSGGNQPLSVAVGDVNADGKADVLMTNYGSNTVSVLLGNGDGTFQPAVIYNPSGGRAVSLAAADVNGDGRLDLLVISDSGGPSGVNGAVGVLLGNGDGTFQAAVPYDSGGWVAEGIAVADVNGDNTLDLVIANNCLDHDNCPDGGGGLGVLLGNGDGTFQAAGSYRSGGYAPYSVAVGNLNADGRPDLLVANFCSSTSCADDGVVGVLLNSIGEIPTTTSLASSLNPSVFGQAVTFTAVVSSSSGTPSGTVHFYDGSTVLGSATLVNRRASLSVSVIAAGAHSITAVYQGTSKFNSSASTPVSQVVDVATTTTSLVSSPNPVALNQPVTYTATVASQYGGTVTGMLRIYDRGVLAAFFILPGPAVYSTVYTVNRAMGAHAITAAFEGDSNNGSSGATLTEYVGVYPVASKTVLTTTGSPSLIGQPVTFTATVTPSNPRDGMIPNGELVTFYDGATTLASVALSGGTAAYTTSSLSAKTHTIKATYVGDSIFKPSTGFVTQVVNKYTTTTTLSSSPNPSQFGQAVTFTAHVTGTGPAPTGKVKFLDGTLAIGSATLSGGVAKITKSNLAVGTHPITAQYLGDAFSAKSTSSVVSQVVQ